MSNFFSSIFGGLFCGCILYIIYVTLCLFFPITWCLATAVKAVSSFFRFFNFWELIITCLGAAVFSVSLHVDFVCFAIYSYLTCSSYSFIICGWLFSMMYLICKCAVILLRITETVWWHFFMLLLWKNFYWNLGVLWYYFWFPIFNYSLEWKIFLIHDSHNYPYHKGCCWHSQICYLSDFQRVQVEQKSSSLCCRCRDYPSLDPWKENLLHLLVYWYSCLLVETKMQCDYFHKDSFGLWTVMYCCLYLLKVAC